MPVNKFEVTVIMVSFYSKDLIEKTINFINKEIEIIVIENSKSSQCKELLENKYSNVKVILSDENLGNGAGINAGLKKTNTKYALKTLIIFTTIYIIYILYLNKGIFDVYNKEPRPYNWNEIKLNI